MQRKFLVGCVSLAALTLIFGLLIAVPAHAQFNSNVRAVVTQNVDEGKLVTLQGNTRPEATRANDRGVLSSERPLQHMLLQLKRSPEQEKALEQYLDAIQKPGSLVYHRWLTAQELGERYGVAEPDLNRIIGWLTAHGLIVNFVYPSRMVIDFSGTAGQVGEAFHTQIHALDVKGVKHIANMSDPRIPAALAPAVAGVVSLHDFMPRPLYKLKPKYTIGSGDSEELAVVPADVATIYNVKPLFTAGTSGQGQTIVVIEDTNVYSTADWTTFRSTFGLSTFTSGSFTQVHPAPPSGTTNCSNPGANGDDVEAILDAEYSSAAAPSAAIELASCSDTQTNFGGFIALQNLLNESATPPAIVSISYGNCEAENGAAFNASISTLYEQAATEGVSVFVSSGDEGAASCDADESNATHGIGVSGYTSTPYNVSVGGTDFGDTYAGTNGTYWSSTNTSAYGSALSYIPEIPWNDSCASLLLATALDFTTTYGSTGFCSSSTASSDHLLTTASGSGGPSACATGAPVAEGVIGGTCVGYAKPSWQSVFGNPADGVRDIPDVSLFAANGVWGHYYVFCNSDPSGGEPCTGAPSGWSGAGGTSISSPIWAGFQALINQHVGSSQGNPNPTYYSLARTEYGSSGSSNCNSANGNGVGISCIFYDVTQGDMDVNCTGTNSCYLPSGTYGVLSTSNSAYDPAYATKPGWDFATGIGTVNVENLVDAWPVVTTPDFSLTAAPGNVTISQGGAGGTSTITITDVHGFTGSVTLAATGLPTGVTAAFGTNPATSSSVVTLTASGSATTGPATVTVTGISGSLTHTATINLTVNPPAPDFSLSSSAGSITVRRIIRGTSTITINPINEFAGTVSFSVSGLPSGAEAFFTPASATTSSVVTIIPGPWTQLGTYTVTVTGTSGSLTHTATLSLTVLW
jgi:subtilase family serine protease